MLCFVLAAICTFLVLLTARKLQRKASKKLDEDRHDISREHSSINDVKMKKAKPSPEGKRSDSSTPDYGSSRGSPYSADKHTGVINTGVIFVEDNSGDSSIRDYPREREDEKSPLLKEKEAETGSVTEASEFGFGVISEATGLWYRDISGKHLMRFMVLLLLLVFSSLVVSEWVCGLCINIRLLN